MPISSLSFYIASCSQSSHFPDPAVGHDFLCSCPPGPPTSWRVSLPLQSPKPCCDLLSLLRKSQCPCDQSDIALLTCPDSGSFPFSGSCGPSACPGSPCPFLYERRNYMKQGDLGSQGSFLSVSSTCSYYSAPAACVLVPVWPCLSRSALWSVQVGFTSVHMFVHSFI